MNFLYDKSLRPHMSMQELCAGFGVGASTAGNKAKLVRDALRMRRFDHHWMLSGLVERNPLIWMPQVNGYFVDIRACRARYSSSPSSAASLPTCRQFERPRI